MMLFCVCSRLPFTAASSLSAVAASACRPDRWTCSQQSRLCSQRSDAAIRSGDKAEGQAIAATSTHSEHKDTSTLRQAAKSVSASDAKVTALTTAAGAARAEGPARNYVSAEMLTEISSKLNKLTGYESIDRLKGSVVEADKQLQQCKQQLRAAKLEYEQQLAKQSQLHREVTALLQRKSSWVPADVSRFTELYAAEHETEQAVAAAKTRYTTLSDSAERLQLQLVDLIRERYQQEQLWSDKIRRASTWWTWGLMGLHFASFLLVYTFLEPRKRAALQAAIADMLEQHAGAVDAKIMNIAPAAAKAEADAAGQGQQLQHILKKQQHQQGPAGQDSLLKLQDTQQQIVQELQQLRQQMSGFQQAVPAAAAGVPSAGPGGRSHWHIPGSRWAAQQWTTSVQFVRSFWHSSRHKLQQVAARHRHGSVAQPQAVEAAAAEPPSEDTAAALAAAAAAADDDEVGKPVAQVAVSQQQAEPPAERSGSQHCKHVQQETAAAAAGAGAADQQQQSAATQPLTGSPRGLIEQWRLGHTVLELTRGQLATVAAGAGAVGASVAGLLILVLRSSRGAGNS